MTQPVMGYRNDGLYGGSVGLALALLGVVLKPLVGVLDMVTMLAIGVRNTAFFLDTQHHAERVHDMYFCVAYFHTIEHLASFE